MMSDPLAQSQPSRNLEIKARCPDLDAAQQAAEAVGAQAAGILRQVDTYFHSSRGRLKLREIEGSGAELIQYHRSDQPSVRASDYIRVPVPDPQALAAALGRALGVDVVVRKARRLLLWHNVRLHLDQVERLGSFVELEAVIGPQDDEPTSVRRLERIIQILKITPEDRLACSYADLIRSETPR